jgi:hypothetical protein
MASAAITTTDAGEFWEQRKGKRTNTSEEAGPTSAKKQDWSKRSEGTMAARMSLILTCNFFSPLRTIKVDSNSAAAGGAV